MAHERTIALAGNPNSGKTSLFNHLTGLRRRVGNYPGVTVERVTGTARLPDGKQARVVDLPGTYSLTARSEDERIARDVLLGRDRTLPRPDVVVAVVDASSLERGLFFTTQLYEMGVPLVVALTMNDLAAKRGAAVDPKTLEARLGVPVVAVDARRGEGREDLLRALDAARVAPRPFQLPGSLRVAMAPVVQALEAAQGLPEAAREGEAMRLLLHARVEDPLPAHRAADGVARRRGRLEDAARRSARIRGGRPREHRGDAPLRLCIASRRGGPTAGPAGRSVRAGGRSADPPRAGPCGLLGRHGHRVPGHLLLGGSLPGCDRGGGRAGCRRPPALRYRRACSTISWWTASLRAWATW